MRPVFNIRVKVELPYLPLEERERRRTYYLLLVYLIRSNCGVGLAPMGREYSGVSIPLRDLRAKALYFWVFEHSANNKKAMKASLSVRVADRPA